MSNAKAGDTVWAVVLVTPGGMHTYKPESTKHRKRFMARAASLLDVADHGYEKFGLIRRAAAAGDPEMVWIPMSRIFAEDEDEAADREAERLNKAGGVEE